MTQKSALWIIDNKNRDWTAKFSAAYTYKLCVSLSGSKVQSRYMQWIRTDLGFNFLQSDVI